MPSPEDLFVVGGITVIIILAKRLRSFGDILGGALGLVDKNQED
jgi:Sec-independent protein translocase protein TatA